jgi:hypothetical protein
LVVLGACIVGACALYLLPFIIGDIRGVPNVGSILVINLFLGWTFIGWVVALAMACRSKSTPVTDVSAQQPPPGRPGI